MIDSVAVADAAKSGFKLNADLPSKAQADEFSQMLGQPNLVDQSLRTFIESAQNQLSSSRVDIDSKLRDFNARDNVLGLIDAMHASSMQSVHVQLTGKIGTKVSEQFEQLIKQQ